MRILARLVPPGQKPHWSPDLHLDPPMRQQGIEAPDRVAARGGSFAGAVRRMFDDLAPGYDRFNRWASLGMDSGWRRAAVRALQLPEDARVLDVATGTGDLALASVPRARVVLGCDFAAEMIRRAAEKASRGAHGKGPTGARIAFQVARAEALPYRSECFDGVTSAFAMRNVRPVLDQVLGEMLRVLRPGGRVAILEFSRPRAAPLRWAHAVHVGWVVPRVGEWLTGSVEPFEYLARSIREWESPRAFAARLEATGFQRVGYRTLSLGAVALHWGTKGSSGTGTPG